jgi:catechol 2,3-dioxygenase-like lactoylglutathione lyase family enzyme
MAIEPAFTGLHFWVRDMERTVAFYRLVGLPVPEDADGEFVSFKLANGQRLAFGTDELTRQYDPGFVPPPARKGGAALQFDLPSRTAVDEMHGRLTGAGYQSHLVPIDAFWGARYCEVVDPDGMVVGFHSPQDRR